MTDRASSPVPSPPSTGSGEIRADAPAAGGYVSPHDTDVA